MDPVGPTETASGPGPHGCLPKEGYITFTEATKKQTWPDTDILIFALMSSTGGNAKDAFTSSAYSAPCILDAANEKR